MENQNVFVNGNLQQTLDRSYTVTSNSYQLTKSQIVYSYIKRVLDFLVSFFSLIILSPVLAVCALVIKFDTPGPVIFKQKRVGRHGKIFYLYKFRTMRTSAPTNIPTVDMKNSRRYITKIGKFLRKTSLDELPQLVNILKGDMSLIGPRPLIVTETQMHFARNQNDVYLLRPGLTGLAQTSGRDYLTIQQKVGFDSYYLHHFSVWQDIRIIFRTIHVVISGKDYAEGEEINLDK